MPIPFLAALLPALGALGKGALAGGSMLSKGALMGGKTLGRGAMTVGNALRGLKNFGLDTISTSAGEGIRKGITNQPLYSSGLGGMARRVFDNPLIRKAAGGLFGDEDEGGTSQIGGVSRPQGLDVFGGGSTYVPPQIQKFSGQNDVSFMQLLKLLMAQQNKGGLY